MPAKPAIARRVLLFVACLGLAATAGPVVAADIAPALARAAAAAKSGDAPGGIEALEQALEKLRLEAPLALKPFMAVSRPAKYFGDFEARQNTGVRAGEALNFYLEPKNLVLSRGTSGSYEPAFEVDLEVFSQDGKSIAKQPRFGSFRLPTRSPAQDIYMNLKVTLSGVPAGPYKIRFVVRDLNSKKSATAEQAITIQ